jgi:hypothetical protein
MLISEAKSFVGQMVQLSWRDRKGDEICRGAEIFDVGFVPLYGPCLITDHGDIRLDRVTSCSAAFAKAA